MNRFILASHGKMSKGVLNTAEMILGKLPNCYAVSTERGETQSISCTIKNLVKDWPKEDTIYILTDVLGGSVNNQALTLLADFPDINVISGMNLPLIFNLLSMESNVSDKDLADILEESRKGIINCSAALKSTSSKEDDL